MVKIKHDDFCPCTRFHTQPEFCNCGAVECEGEINASLERFGKRLREINENRRTRGLKTLGAGQ